MEPFKNNLGPKLVREMGSHLRRVWSGFDEEGFIGQAGKGLAKLELKERSTHIKDALVAHLPDDFEMAAEYIVAALGPVRDDESPTLPGRKDGITGWGIMPLTHYVGECGLGRFDLGMETQRLMTARWSSEFGVRFFLLHDQRRALSIMKQWIRDPDHHVRRLASEGCRPRLPWAMQLPRVIENPRCILPILRALRDDDSEYVRRSVANNLNDIAKDHPDLIAELAAAWMKRASDNRKRLVRHACRTLVKAGHQATLEALGFKPARVRLRRFVVETPVVTLGGALEFEIELESAAKHDQELILDYIVHHRKARGGTSPKVFKWKTFTLSGKATHQARRRHAVRKITTRVYYAGDHYVELMANGKKLGRRKFALRLK